MKKEVKFLIPSILNQQKRAVVLTLDIFLLIASYGGAFLLRFDGQIPEKQGAFFLSMLPLVLIFKVPCFYYFGFYRTVFRYVGTQDFISILKAATAGSVLLTFVSLFIGIHFHPRSIFILDWLLLVSSLCGLRVFLKIVALKLYQPHKAKKNVTMVGAEDACEVLLREFIKQPRLGYRAVGLIDPEGEKTGMTIHGVRVLGDLSTLDSLIRSGKVDEVMIVSLKISREDIRHLFRACRSKKIPCRIIPQSSVSISTDLLPFTIRPVNVSDLLGRDLAQIDFSVIENFFRDKRVLITGGGGSIGSELAKVIAQNHPQELILVDNSENNLHEIMIDLRRLAVDIELSGYLNDITDQNQMEKIFTRHEPHIVYHAAAYKHVPMMEAFFGPGIINNVLGTKIVADLALKYAANYFVLISTDKAIRPQSIMGSTKRIAELYIQSLKNAKGKFLTVRFGNVFNSKGSVVSLFKKQIEEGLPLTITHPEVKRYFMDVSEAVFLILQATILGSGSEVFMLEMGPPIKIVDLARDLAEFMGVPEEDVSIQYIGLRPGDKLDEELIREGEEAIPTLHKKIKIWKSLDFSSDISEYIERLLGLVHQGASREQVVEKIKERVPDFEPWEGPSPTPEKEIKESLIP